MSSLESLSTVLLSCLISQEYSLIQSASGVKEKARNEQLEYSSTLILPCLVSQEYSLLQVCSWPGKISTAA